MVDIILYKQQVHGINLNNSGTMNQSNLDFTKRTMLFDVIREHTELVETKQGYPNSDVSEVQMTIDCVVMSRKRYEMLLKNLGKSKELKKETENYLKFPKLKV